MLTLTQEPDSPLEAINQEVARRATIRNPEVLNRVLRVIPVCRFAVLFDRFCHLDEQVGRHKDRLNWNREWGLRYMDLRRLQGNAWREIQRDNVMPCLACPRCLAMGDPLKIRRYMFDYLEELKKAARELGVPMGRAGDDRGDEDGGDEASQPKELGGEPEHHWEGGGWLLS